MIEYPPEVEERIRRECRRFKEPLPEKLKNKPELIFGNALFLNAWFDLDVERQRPSRITRSMCFDYARDYEFDFEQTEDLWFHIQRMDAEFLPWWAKRQPKKGQSGGPQ